MLPIRKQNSERARSGNRDDGNELMDFFDTPCKKYLPIKAFTLAEVKSERSKLNTPQCTRFRTSLRPHLETFSLLYKPIVLLLNNFICMLITVYFSTIWKYAKIIMVQNTPPRNRNPTDHLPLFSKELEWLLLKMIQEVHKIVITSLFRITV